MKKHRIVLIALFVVPIFVLSVLYFVLPKPTESLEEKRKFNFPEFSFSSLISGKYTVELENYFSDTFVFRDFFMDADNAIKSAFLLENKDGDRIYDTQTGTDLGNGENLFNEGLTPTPTPDPNAPPTPPPIVIDEKVEDKGAVIISNNRAMEIFYRVEQGEDAYIGVINHLYENMPDVNFYMMLVPTSIEFYAPEKYTTVTHSQKASIDKIYASVNKNIKTVDAYGWLLGYANEYIYFRTDHHWTARGAYAAYTAFSKMADFTPTPLDAMQTATIQKFLGTLYTTTKSTALSENPDVVEVFYPIHNYTCTGYQTGDLSAPGIDVKAIYLQLDNAPNKYLTFFGGDYGVLHAVTENKNGRKILMTKDSFGNAFGVFLLNDFEEVYLIDSRIASVDLPSFIQEHGITDVLIENYAFAIDNSKIINGLNGMIK